MSFQLDGFTVLGAGRKTLSFLAPKQLSKPRSLTFPRPEGAPASRPAPSAEVPPSAGRHAHAQWSRRGVPGSLQPLAPAPGAERGARACAWTCGMTLDPSASALAERAAPPLPSLPLQLWPQHLGGEEPSGDARGSSSRVRPPRGPEQGAGPQTSDSSPETDRLLPS